MLVDTSLYLQVEHLLGFLLLLQRGDLVLLELLVLDEVVDERGLDVEEPCCLPLACSFSQHEPENLRQLCQAELVLLALPLLPAAKASFEAKLEVLALSWSLSPVVATVELRLDEALLLLAGFTECVLLCFGLVGLLLELVTQPRSNSCILEQAFLGQPIGVNVEGLGHVLEVVGVEHELAAVVVHLPPDGLERPVELEVFSCPVHHDSLLPDQLERLDSGPEQRLAARLLHFFL